MDLNIINNEEKFLSGKLDGHTLKGAENKFDHKGNPLLFSEIGRASCRERV